MSHDPDQALYNALERIENALLRIANAIESPQVKDAHKSCGNCGCGIVPPDADRCPACYSAKVRP